jgi:putative transposase
MESGLTNHQLSEELDQQRGSRHRHRHSGIKFVTPVQRHSGSTIAICKQRAEVYETARRANPTRWSRQTRCWHQPEEVWINKPSEESNPILELPLIKAT